MIRLRGVPEAERAVANALDAVAEAAKREVWETAKVVETGAQNKAPVRRGVLKASIKREQRDGGRKASVATHSGYGAYVELGTFRTPAQPFLFPALEEARYPERMEQAIQQAVEGLRVL